MAAVRVALAAIAVPIAEGTSSAKDPRVPALARKVAVLQGNVAALKDDVATLQKSLSAVKKQADALATKADCLGVRGAVQRSDGVRGGLPLHDERRQRHRARDSGRHPKPGGGAGLPAGGRRPAMRDPLHEPDAALDITPVRA